MKHPFVLAFGLILLAAAAGAYVGPLYVESGEFCGTLLRPEATTHCETYEQRRWIVLLLLLAVALSLVIAELLRSRQSERRPRRVNSLLAAASGLLTLPIALVILAGVATLDRAVYGFSQAHTGLPYVFAPAVLAVGALVSARLAVRAGADAGTALAAAAVGLPLLLSVQAVAEAFRWRLDDIAAPLLLSGPFSHHQADVAVTLATLALAALPMPLLLGVAAWSRRRLPAGLGAGLLFLSSLVGSVLFEATDIGLYPVASIRWLPLVLLPVGLAVLAMCTCSRMDQPAPHAELV